MGLKDEAFLSPQRRLPALNSDHFHIFSTQRLFCNRMPLQTMSKHAAA